VKQLADDLHLLRGFPPNGINVYLMGDVVIDAATKFAKRRILKQISGYPVSANALTHVHPDHQGASKAICERLGIPLWCGEHDVRAMETGDMGQKDVLINRFADWAWSGPPYKVSRVLREGDELAGFKVLDVPGHSPGHVAYWRGSDRTLICGDVLNNMNVFTGTPGLHEPPEAFTSDIPRNRESARKLAKLEPALVCFGHGKPLRDTAKFVQFIEQLPQ
jgi:glyoxylase-like metal-dependent hydrolase (beta-lactamase superfamily II)